MKAVLAEVPAGGAVLAHKKLNKEITQEHPLKHVETAHDASKPAIPADAHVGEAPQKKVFEEIGKEHQLKHVETTHDASKPAIDPEVKIGEAPMKSVLQEVAAGSTVMAHKLLNKEISTGGPDLKHVEPQHDASKPHIDPSVHLREAPQKKVFEEISKEHPLKHVETTHDASKPHIDPTVKVGEAPMKAMSQELLATVAHKAVTTAIAQPHELKHVEPTRDASKPVIPKDAHVGEAPQVKVFAEIGKEHQLKHVETTHDASKPAIPKDAHVGENPHKAVLQEVQAAVAHKAVKAEITQPHELKHVEPAHDASKPVIPKDAHVGEAPQVKVFWEVQQEHQLKHVETTHDASKPAIPKDAHVGEAPQKAILQEVQAAVAHKAVKAEIGQEHALKHVETTHDASKPVIDPHVHVGEAPQKKVLEAVKGEHALKHVETTHDASKPVIAGDAHVGEAPQKKVLEEIKKADK